MADSLNPPINMLPFHLLNSVEKRLAQLKKIRWQIRGSFCMQEALTPPFSVEPPHL